MNIKIEKTDLTTIGQDFFIYQDEKKKQIVVFLSNEIMFEKFEKLYYLLKDLNKFINL